MMLRKTYTAGLAILMILFVTKSFGQREKSEIAIGGGYWSSYSLYNGAPFNVSSGSYSLTYRYYITKDFTLGLGAGTENISNWGSFVTIAPEITGTYLDTRKSRVRVRLYGAFSYGISIFTNNDLKEGHANNNGVWFTGLQATPFGIRIGRQFAYYAEVGFGYQGLVHTGIEVRFPRILARNRRHIDD